MKTYQTLLTVVIATCYIYSNGAAASGTCNFWYGPAGNAHCVKFDVYSDYQWATCRSNIYIRTKSNFRHACIYRYATYCYYQCMLDVYDKEDGYVLPYCKCSPSKPQPTETIPLPAWCHSPNGASCSWYRECLSKAYPQCNDDDDEYAIKYAEKFCKLYDENLKDFSTQGKNWVNAVRKCLQLKLVPVIDTTRQKTCTELKSAAFETHTPCYLNPASSAPSYCDLSIGDQWTVFWTIKSAFVDAFGPSLKGLYDVMTGCTRKKVDSIKEKTKEIIKAAVDEITDLAADIGTRVLQETTARIKTWLKEALSPSFPFPIQLDLRIGFDDFENFQTRRKRSVEDDLETTRSRLAGKIIDAIALAKKWKDEGVAWFAYASNKTEHANNKTEHANNKTEHANNKTEHANNKTEHANNKTEHANNKTEHANNKTEHANNKTEHDNTTMSIRFLVTDRSKYESTDDSSKPSDLTTTLVELSEVVLKGTLNNLIVDGERIDIIALNGCLDWNCEENTFNVTFMEFEANKVPVTTTPGNQTTRNQTKAKPKVNKAAMYTMSLATLALFIIISLNNIS